MKSFFIIASLILFSTAASAQDSLPSDSTKTTIRKEMPKHGKGMTKDMQINPAGSRNMRNNGIPDSLQQKLGKHQGKGIPQDRFIDTDGDGINDNRCGSMGITPKKQSTEQKENK